MKGEPRNNNVNKCRQGELGKTIELNGLDVSFHFSNETSTPKLEIGVRDGGYQILVEGRLILPSLNNEI